MTKPPLITYAIGDVHGEAERLAKLHDVIFDRHEKRYESASMRLIYLGDYIDRGPDSAGVIDQIRARQASMDIEIIALAGNHEAMMINALESGRSHAYQHWLRNGGQETLKSYRDHGYDQVPRAHLDWARHLPTIFYDRAERWVFVHAGVHPSEFPNDAQSVHLWTRSADFFDVNRWQGTALEGWTVVHGHTPTKNGRPDISGDHSRRINIDTGAVFGGRLTCAVMQPGADVRFLYA